jgi:hypothetical protein
MNIPLWNVEGIITAGKLLMQGKFIQAAGKETVKNFRKLIRLYESGSSKWKMSVDLVCIWIVDLE